MMMARKPTVRRFRVGLTLLLAIVLGFVAWQLVGACKMAHRGGDVLWYVVSLFDDATEFGEGYTEGGFERVQNGNTMMEVVDRIGRPITVVRAGPDSKSIYLRVSERQWQIKLERIRQQKPGTVKTKGTATHRARGEVWIYSEAPPDRNYWVREVVFDSLGRVARKNAWYFMD